MSDLPADNRGDRKPIPDPTTLTTEALHREADSIRREMKASLRLCDEHIDGIEGKLNLRLEHLEEKSRESGTALQMVTTRYPIMIGFCAAVGLFAIVLLVMKV